jgi:DNA polymerase-3 subunit chi
VTRIDFYLLKETQAKDRMACALADKAYRLGHRVYILAADAAHSEILDELLWTFHPGSFVPHGLNSKGSELETDAPVLIGHEAPPDQHHDVLISLWRDVPTFFSRFARLVEIVGPDEDDKAQSRVRFRFYRDRGYPLETHNV